LVEPGSVFRADRLDSRLRDQSLGSLV